MNNKLFPVPKKSQTQCCPIPTPQISPATYDNFISWLDDIKLLRFYTECNKYQIEHIKPPNINNFKIQKPIYIKLMKKVFSPLPEYSDLYLEIFNIFKNKKCIIRSESVAHITTHSLQDWITTEEIDIFTISIVLLVCSKCSFEKKIHIWFTFSDRDDDGWINEIEIHKMIYTTNILFAKYFNVFKSDSIIIYQSIGKINAGKIYNMLMNTPGYLREVWYKEKFIDFSTFYKSWIKINNYKYIILPCCEDLRSLLNSEQNYKEKEYEINENISEDFIQISNELIHMLNNDNGKWNIKKWFEDDKGNNRSSINFFSQSRKHFSEIVPLKKSVDEHKRTTRFNRKKKNKPQIFKTNPTNPASLQRTESMSSSVRMQMSSLRNSKHSNRNYNNSRNTNNNCNNNTNNIYNSNSNINNNNNNINDINNNNNNDNNNNNSILENATIPIIDDEKQFKCSNLRKSILKATTFKTQNIASKYSFWRQSGNNSRRLEFGKADLDKFTSLEIPPYKINYKSNIPNTNPPQISRIKGSSSSSSSRRRLNSANKSTFANNIMSRTAMLRTTSEIFKDINHWLVKHGLEEQSADKMHQYANYIKEVEMTMKNRIKNNMRFTDDCSTGFYTNKTIQKCFMLPENMIGMKILK